MAAAHGYTENEGNVSDNCIIERDSQGGESVMVWAGVSLIVKTNIVFIKWNLTAARYLYGGHSIVEEPQKNAIIAR